MSGVGYWTLVGHRIERKRWLTDAFLRETRTERLIKSKGREVGNLRTVKFQNGAGDECERLRPGMCTTIVGE